ncbi:MAG: hypothetical protein KKE17_04270 [Proteobacteria bacterium]|nr:hypothetical protein [Pseudomonadota bacterium]MBU1709201.1 hypothetical protein [Pseudomonadota bacterium]
MMKKMIALLGLIAITVLSGCASQESGPVGIPDESAQEKLIWSSQAERPAWTMEEPDTEGDVMSFVGVSDRFASEKGAREDARRNAMESVVKYMGTLVKDKFEKAAVSFGLESSVVDPTASAREFEKQLAVNMASSVKMKSWYMEKWQTTTGVGWQAFVLGKVPRSAIDDTYKNTARAKQKDAEQKAKDAADEVAKAQAEKAADFWKQMQEQGVVE